MTLLLWYKIVHDIAFMPLILLFTYELKQILHDIFQERYQFSNCFMWKRWVWNLFLYVVQVTSHRMELRSVKIVSGLALFILSLCFGLIVPFLIWRSKSPGYRRINNGYIQDTDSLISSEGGDDERGCCSKNSTKKEPPQRSSLCFKVAISYTYAHYVSVSY